MANCNTCYTRKSRVGYFCVWTMGNQPLTKGLPEIQSIRNPIPGESDIFRNPNWNTLDFSQTRTLYESFTSSVTKYPTNKCLGWRPRKDAAFEWMNYSDLQERSLDFGSGLRARGMNEVCSLLWCPIDNQKNRRLGIYSINRTEWIIAEQACYAYSFIPIALYDTLGPDACSFIIQDAQIEYIVSSIEKLLLVSPACLPVSLISYFLTLPRSRMLNWLFALTKLRMNCGLKQRNIILRWLNFRISRKKEEENSVRLNLRVRIH